MQYPIVNNNEEIKGKCRKFYLNPVQLMYFYLGLLYRPLCLGFIFFFNFQSCEENEVTLENAVFYITGLQIRSLN